MISETISLVIIILNYAWVLMASMEGLYPVGAACAQWKIGGGGIFRVFSFTEICDSSRRLQSNIQASLPLLIITYLLWLAVPWRHSRNSSIIFNLLHVKDF